MSWKYCNVCILSLSFTKSGYVAFRCRCLLYYIIPIRALVAVHFFTALRPVDSDLCLNPPPLTTQLCHINCPVECEVSSWSAWGPCTYENCQDQTAKKGKILLHNLAKLCLHHSTWKSRLFFLVELTHPWSFPLWICCYWNGLNKGHCHNLLLSV